MASIEPRRLLHSLVMIRCEKWTYDAPASDWLVASGLATQQDFEDKTTEFELTSAGLGKMADLESKLAELLGIDNIPTVVAVVERPTMKQTSLFGGSL